MKQSIFCHKMDRLKAKIYEKKAKLFNNVLNYNYVCINNDITNYFYFITNMFGLYDSENPITEITLKRDAWSNNIEYFTDHQETDKFNSMIREEPYPDLNCV